MGAAHDPILAKKLARRSKKYKGEKTMILFQNRLMKREEAVVDIEDRGYQFGDGIYEVIRVYEGQFFGFREHMQRLERSVAEIRMELPLPLEEIEEKLRQLLEENELTNGIVYMQITRGTAVRVHQFPRDPKPILTAYTKEMARPLDQFNNGIHTRLVEDVRWLRCDIKSLNLLGNVLAKQEAQDHQCAEAILHRGDTVSEGSSSNAFIINGKELQTHPANSLILNGITRRQVLAVAGELGLDIKEEPFTVKELLAADEAFITSTTSEVTPIIQVDQTKIGIGKPGTVTRQLQEAFAELLPSVV